VRKKQGNEYMRNGINRRMKEHLERLQKQSFSDRSERTT
jgi:hypothetical protein